jgi:small GTP-binding protein
MHQQHRGYHWRVPTNLPPEYFTAERHYKEASDPHEKVIRLEALIGTVPKHKGTDKLRADLRRKLSKLRDAAQTKKKGGSGNPAWQIEKTGAGMIVLVGPANAGKSALLEALTNAAPEVSPAPQTTWQPTPGMLEVGKVQFQLIDTPSIDREFIEPALMDLIRRADLVIPVVDLTMDPNRQLEDTLNQMREHRIDPTVEANGRKRMEYAPILVLANKCDDAEAEENLDIFRRLLEGDWPVMAASAVTGRGLEELGWEIFNRLKIMRIYSKTPGKDPNMEAPFVMKSGGTVEEFAREIHQDFFYQLKSARVWGEGVFEGQMVGRDHVLHDGDIVELRR